jgi:hypothetical protein
MRMQKKTRKIVLSLMLGFFVFAPLSGFVKADIEVAIEVRDASNNSLKGETVPLNTLAYINGTYEDLNGTEDGDYSMKVLYSDVGFGGPWTPETEWTGIVNDGATISKQWTMNKLGYYKFTWHVENSYDEGLVSTKVGPVIPEIPFGTIMATVASFAALGVLIRKKRFQTSY